MDEILPPETAAGDAAEAHGDAAEAHGDAAEAHGDAAVFERTPTLAVDVRHPLHVGRSSLVDASPARVWETLTDPERIASWFADVTEAHAEGDAVTLAEGTAVHLHSALFDVDAVVDEADDPSALAIRMTSGFFGPINHWRIRVSLEPEDNEEDGSRTRVTVANEWAGRVPVFAFIFSPLIRSAMKKSAATTLAALATTLAGRQHRRREHPPWWAPTVAISRPETSMLSTICAYAVVMGFMTSLTSIAQHQIIESFHSNDAGLGRMFFAIGIGAIPGLFILPLGDRIGRRRILIPALALTAVCTFASGFAPNLPVFTALQALSRAPLFVALALAWIYLIEEMPAGVRAFSLSLFTMSGGLGAGVGLFGLPLVMRVSSSGWRILYLFGIVGLLTVPLFARHLKETRRFEHAWHNAGIRTLARVPHRRWLILVGVLAVLSALFGSPAARYQGRYIQHGLGYTPGMYVLFTVVTTLPGGAGMIIGGRLADTIGRRKVGITAATVGAGSQALLYLLTGAPLWIVSAIGSFIGAMWVPALGSYTTELFPTALRSGASTVSSALGMGSGALGSLIAGQLIVTLGGYGPAILLLLPFALASAGLMYLFFPETARRELEDISPDIGPPSGLPGGGFGPI